MKRIKDSYDLYEYLDKKYGSRFNADLLVAMTGAVQGTFDGELFSITYLANNYLLLTVFDRDSKIASILINDFNEVMGNQPIISYEMNHKDKGQDIVKPTIEWDVAAPEERIKEIINGRAFPDKPEITNIKLYNGKNVDDYLETKEEADERVKNARIYGIDPGSIKDVEAVKNLSELDLFFQISGLGHHIWRCRHEMYHGRIPQIDLTEEQYALEYMVYLTTKFGVELNEPEIDQHIKASESYNAWYSFYNEHFNKKLTQEEWNEFVRVKESGGDITPYLPQGDWRDLIVSGPKKELK